MPASLLNDLESLVQMLKTAQEEETPIARIQMMIVAVMTDVTGAALGAATSPRRRGVVPPRPERELLAIGLAILEGVEEVFDVDSEGPFTYAYALRQSAGEVASLRRWHVTVFGSHVLLDEIVALEAQGWLD